MEPADLPTRESEAAGSSATQLSILLSSATSQIEEEFKRSERLDAKSRNQITITATFFAVVQAGVIALVNGSLAATEKHGSSSFIPVLAGIGIVAGIAVAIAVALSYNAWKLHDDPALSPKTITDYRDAARAGNPAVGVKLIDAYVKILSGRRENNETRAKALERAGIACGVAFGLIAVELIAAFVAAAAQ
jgi:hypothetical protein